MAVRQQLGSGPLQCVRAPARNHISAMIDDVYRRVEARWTMIQSAPLANVVDAMNAQPRHGVSTEKYSELLQRYLGRYLMARRELQQALRRRFKGRDSEVTLGAVVEDVKQQVRPDFVEYQKGVEGFSQRDAERLAGAVRLVTHIK